MTQDSRPSEASIRRQVLGDAYVDRTAQQGDLFLAPFFEAVPSTSWGGLWNRPGPGPEISQPGGDFDTRRHRQCTSCKPTCAASLNLGWTPEELREALLQLGGYAGFPPASKPCAS